MRERTYAFPDPARANNGGLPRGMTLRDWFAGQALVGLLACPEGEGSEEFVAGCAYQYADAMLKERGIVQ